MATYASIFNPGLVNEEGDMKPFNRLFTGGVATGQVATSLQAVQRGAGANMSVDVSVGDALIELPSKAYAFWAWTDGVTNVTVPTANATNPRVDRLVAWVDKTVNTTSSANNPGSLKFSIITGTPSASPSAVTDTAVQASLGAAIPWVALAYIYVGAGVTSITSTNITDNRTATSLLATVGATAISPSAITLGYAQITANFQTAVDNAPKQVPSLTVTVNIPSGGRRIKVTAFTPALYYSSGSTAAINMSIWDGVVGSGTQLTYANMYGNFNTPFAPATAIAILTPSAGSKTYNVGLQTTNISNAGAGMLANANGPAFILVEAI